MSATCTNSCLEFLQALRAHRKRGCKVELETRGVRHLPAQIFLQAMQHEPDLDDAELVSRSCTILHERIRVSLG